MTFPELKDYMGKLINDWRERRAIRGLDPRDMPDAERGLLKIREENCDPWRRREEVHVLFESLRDRIKSAAEKLRREIRDRFDQRIADLEEKVLAPDFPVYHISVDHALKSEKARAMANVEQMKVDVQEIPEVSNGQRAAAAFLMILSFFGNYLTVTLFVGDFLGNDTLTLAATAVISAVLSLAEVVGLYILVLFMGRWKIPALKVLGFVSAGLLVAGVVMLVLARSEIGAVATQATNIGFAN